MAENGETFAESMSCWSIMLDREQCYQAVLTRDKRFDGLFYVAVMTTRIYCRPICPSKRPRFEHCLFFQYAAGAEAAGFRPCLRCRPELAPGLAPVDQRERLLNAALRHIAELGSELRLETLAGRLGVSERHLRRVINSAFGLSPIELVQTQRLLMAKRLLSDTSLPIIDVAFVSGFSSLRRFNFLFRDRYQLTPGRLRKKRGLTSQSPRLSCFLAYRAPFDWEACLQFLSRRLFGGVETIVDGRYWRTVQIGRYAGWLMAENEPAKDRLRVQVSPELVPVLGQLLLRVRHLFDLDAVPDQIATSLGDVAAPNPGIRVPGAFNGFEVAVRAVLGQQISVAAATTLAGRLAVRFGDPLSTPVPGLSRLTPSPERLAQASQEDIGRVGMPHSRAAALRALAEAVSSKQLDLESNHNLKQALRQLSALPGFGDWTVQYIAMRAYAWPDSFPASDLGLLRALKVNKSKAAIRLAEKWRPWRAYAVMHLWKSLENSL